MARFIALVLALGLSFWLDAQAARARALVLGSVSSDPSDEMKDWLPFARHLAGELAADGISEGRVVVARDPKEMAALLKAGKVDLYIDSPLVMLDVANASGSKLLARRWKKGAAEYTAVIFTRKDSGITSLEELKGKVIAFQKESSSTGYLLPLLELQRAGLTVEPLDNRTAAPQAGHVGSRFTGADRNTMAWVLYGRVAAGATSRTDLEKASEEQSAQFSVIAETAPIPRHVVAYRGDLPPALVARIKTLLIEMNQTDEGRKALTTFERTTKFDEIPKRSLEALLRYQDALQTTRLSQ